MCERAESLLDKLNKISQLQPRYAYVLSLRFGITGTRIRTQREVGELVGFSPERARQIEGVALRKLRHPGIRHDHPFLESFLSNAVPGWATK